MINQKEKVRITLTCEQLDTLIEGLYTVPYEHAHDNLMFILGEFKEVLSETNYGKNKIEMEKQKEKAQKIIHIDEIRGHRAGHEFAKKYWHLI